MKRLNKEIRYEGNFAIYTDAGLVAWGISMEHAELIAARIKYGSVKIATTSGTVLKIVRP